MTTTGRFSTLLASIRLSGGALPGTGGSESTPGGKLERFQNAGFTALPRAGLPRGPAPWLRFHTFKSPAEAKAFFDAPELAEAMAKAGVDASSVQVEYLDEIAFISTITSQDPGITEPGITGPETDTHRLGGPL